MRLGILGLSTLLDRFDMPRDEAKADAKSEGKEDDAGGKGAKGEPTPTVSVTKIEVEPNDCALEDPLDLSIEFILDGEVTDAWWEIKARLARRLRREPATVIASTRRARSIWSTRFGTATSKVRASSARPAGVWDLGCRDALTVLGRTEPTSYAPGPCSMFFEVGCRQNLRGPRTQRRVFGGAGGSHQCKPHRAERARDLRAADGDAQSRRQRHHRRQPGYSGKSLTGD